MPRSPERIAHTIALLATLALVGCAGPFAVFPGGALEGEVVALDAASFPKAAFPDSSGVIQLETRPEAPYSVNLTARRVGDHVYIDPAVARTWYEHIQADDRVRVRLPGSDAVYLARAIPERDAGVLAGFEADRIVLRLVPRSD